MNLSFFVGNGLMKGGGGVMEESVADNGIPAMFVGVRGGGGGAVGGGNGSGIDPELWHACAGQTVQLPQAGSRVIYFAQGHAEHASSPPPLPPGTPYAIACVVASVHYLADPDTDEVFARIRLRPLLQDGLDTTDDKNGFENVPIGSLNGQIGAENGSADNDFLLSHLQREKLAAFAKTLTQSDANNGGGFSVPRYCAESIFPKLDYAADPPVQSVLAKDVHGIVWKFRHIYRGTPRRHLLTTGWSNFVNQKRLVAGDSIVFLRNHAGELCVGVRRSVRGLTPRSPFAATHHHPQQQQQQQQQQPPRPLSSSSRWDGGKGLDSTYDFHGNHRTPKQAGFRHNPGRVSPQSVVEAVANATSGKVFEVVYYPRGNMSEFCVRAHVVKCSLQHNWVAGMRFKMPIETDDSSRVNWFLGTISKVQDVDQLHWPNSPWKMLQVTWDEPDLLHSVTRVSPWQIELVSPVQLPPFALAYKKLRVGQPSELQLDNQEYMGLTTLATLPWNGFEGSPVGSQGTRHDQIYFHQKFIPNIYLNNLYNHRESPGGGVVGGVVGVGRGRVGVVGGVGVGVGYGVSTELNSDNVYNREKPTIPNGKNYAASLIVGNAPSEGVASTNISKSDLVSCAKSASSTQFMLFGKSIVKSLSCAPEQKSAGSSPEAPEIDTVLDGGHPEEFINVRRFLCSSADVPKHADNLSHGFYHDDSQTSATHGDVDLKCIKEDKGLLDGDKDGNTVGDNFLHCKIFRENEEVGRTVDLSSFSSYGELCKRLARMFQIDESTIWSRVIYMDPGGLFKQIGGEPYMDFMKRTRRLKILADSSDEALMG